MRKAVRWGWDEGGGDGYRNDFDKTKLLCLRQKQHPQERRPVAKARTARTMNPLAIYEFIYTPMQARIMIWLMCVLVCPSRILYAIYDWITFT